MAKTHITFRLSTEALNVILEHQRSNSFVDRTDALEDILARFWQWHNKPGQRIKRFLGSAEKTKPLEGFTHT